MENKLLNDPAIQKLILILLTRPYTPVTLQGGITYVYRRLKSLKIVEVEILNILKLLCLETSEARKAHRQKCIGNYRNMAFHQSI